MQQRYPTTKHVTDEIVAKIDMPLDTALISSRQAGGNTTVAFIKGDIVADQLNTVFGPLGWGLEAKIGTTEAWEEMKSVRRNNQMTDVNMHMIMVVSDVTLRIKPMTEDGTETVFIQPGIGYGEAEVGKSRKDAYGMAVKGAATDGLKRCASLLGKAFGMMMASGGSQEDIQYAHNANRDGLAKARNIRRDAAPRQIEDRSSERDAPRQIEDRSGDRGPSRPDERPQREAAPAGRRDERSQRPEQERQVERGRGSDADVAERRPDEGRAAAPRHDETPRGAGQQQVKDGGKDDAGDASPRSGGKPAGAKAGVRRASTDFNLETLPVSQQEMTDFAATLVERVKELRQDGDRKSLLKQHTNTIRNLDSKIRTRLIERLAEAGIEDEAIRA